MAEHEFISKTEFEELFQPLGQDLYSESNGIIKPSLTKIQAYCSQFINEYNIYITKSGLTAQGQANTNLVSSLLTQATFILYEIRSALIGEDIQFIIGTTSAKGTRITAQIYDQREVLHNLKLDLRNMEMHVKNKLEASKQDNNFLNSSILSQWGQVIQWAAVPNWREAKKIKGNITEHTTYEKLENDINIYFLYSGKRHQLSTYYGEHKQYFNRGWLFEWYLGYIDQLMVIPDVNINDDQYWPAPTSLSKMIGANRMDSVKGYKGGDVRIQNQAFQAKMGNHRIIRVGDLYNAIRDLNNILSKYLSGELDATITAKEIGYLFTEYDAQTGVVETINKDFNEIVDDILKGLGKFNN